MERRAKERLVGAVVLMAAAIIVIPEMLSGPREQQPSQKPSAGEAPLKTYTIDLNASPGAETPKAVPSPEPTLPPPAVDTVPTPASAPQVNPEPVVSAPPSSSAQATTAPVEPERKQQEVAAVVQPRDSEPSTTSAAPPPKALAPKPNAPTSRGWAVQVASFSRESTAQKLASDLKGRGYDAFVVSAKSAGGTRYRVRVGPVGERSAAEANLRKLKSVAPDATVVSHP